MRILRTLTHVSHQIYLRASIGICVIGLATLFLSIRQVSAFPLGQTTLPGTPTRGANSSTPTPTRSATAPLPTPTALFSLDPKSRIYTVENGDSLWSIAQKVYGNGSKYTFIQRANNLGDRAKLQTGMALIVPPLESEESVGGPLVMPIATREPTPLPLMQSAMVPPPIPTASSSSDTLSVSASDSMVEPITPPLVKKTAYPVVGYFVLVLNLLSGLFFLASVLCSYLSFDIYWRSRGYAHRRNISSRIRAGLYT